MMIFPWYNENGATWAACNVLNSVRTCTRQFTPCTCWTLRDCSEFLGKFHITGAILWTHLVLLPISPITPDTQFHPLWALGVNSVHPRLHLCLLMLTTSCLVHCQADTVCVLKEKCWFLSMSQDQLRFQHKSWKIGKSAVVSQLWKEDRKLFQYHGKVRMLKV